MTWTELSLDQRRAARDLLRAGHWRSCVSRSYYAVYAALVARLLEVFPGPFRYDRKNPGHDEIRRNHLFRLSSRYSVKDLEQSQWILQLYREDADYRPHKSVDETTARTCFDECVRVTTILGVRADEADS